MEDTWSRRGVLAAAAGVSVVGVGGTAGAQNRLTTRMVSRDADDFLQGDDYGGYFLHVGEAVETDLDPENFADCEFDSWPPDSMARFKARLIDRYEEPHREIETEVWVPDETDIESGTLWIIDDTVSCPAGYVGFAAEQIGSGFVVENTSAQAETATPEDDPPGGVPQPGFGPAAAVVALLTTGYALVRGSRDD